MMYIVVSSLFEAEVSACHPTCVLDESSSCTAQDSSLLLTFVLQTSVIEICSLFLLLGPSWERLKVLHNLLCMANDVTLTLERFLRDDVKMTLPAASQSAPIKQRN